MHCVRKHSLLPLLFQEAACGGSSVRPLVLWAPLSLLSTHWLAPLQRDQGNSQGHKGRDKRSPSLSLFCLFTLEPCIPPTGCTSIHSLEKSIRSSPSIKAAMYTYHSKLHSLPLARSFARLHDFVQLDTSTPESENDVKDRDPSLQYTYVWARRYLESSSNAIKLVEKKERKTRVS